MAGKNFQKKRFWADEEKRSICQQALAPGVSVAQVARRYAMNANLIFKWIKDPRFSPAAGETPGAPEGEPARRAPQRVAQDPEDRSR